MMSGELACKEIVELVTDYLEGVLTDEDERRFEQHLAGCEGCGAYLDQMRKTIAIAGRIEAEELPDAVCEELVMHFRAWARSER